MSLINRIMAALSGGIVVLAACLSPAPLYAQGGGFSASPHHRFDGTGLGDYFGHDVANAGDVDGDGFDDVIHGTPTTDLNGHIQVGSAFVHSGATGNLLYRYDGTGHYSRLGISVSGGGDVNGDGFDDFIIGGDAVAVPGTSDLPGSVFVYSGATGNLLYRFDGPEDGSKLGWSVSNAGDVNNDGFDDIIAGALKASPNNLTEAGSAIVFSGLDGSVLHRFDGSAEYDSLGTTVSGAGDIDGDGFDDVMVSGTPLTPSGVYASGTVFVYSGATGGLLYGLQGSANHDYFGYVTASAGDVNADGFGDFVIGAPQANPNGLYLAGSALVFSGATGGLLHEFHGIADRNDFGRSVDGVGDLDGDGFDDVIVGSPWWDYPNSFRGSAFVYSGATGNLLHQFHGDSIFDKLGWSVAGGGDINGDGRDDVIIGALSARPNGHINSGSVYVHTFEPYISCSTDTVSASFGGVFFVDIDFPEDLRGLRYKVLLSASGPGMFTHGIDIPLALDHWVRQSNAGNYPFVASFYMQGSLDNYGNAQPRIHIAAGAVNRLVGRTFHLAAIANHPGSLPEHSTVALPFTVVP